MKPVLRESESRKVLKSRWRGIIARCCNPASPRFKDYGGRGISICVEWRNDFDTFYHWSISHGFVKPSVVVVPTCKTTKDNRFTHGCERPEDRGVSSRGGIIRRFANRRTPSRTVAWNPASKGTLGSAAFVASQTITWNTACGDGACDPHMANKFRSGESRLVRKPPTTRTATSARSVLLSFQPTKPKKESNMMNKVMVSLFAVILAAFAVSAVMRERVKVEAECLMMEVAR